MFFENCITSFLNLIYKQNCLICNCAKVDNFLCKTCLKDVHNLSSFAHRVYKNIPIYSAYIYSGSIKKLIQLLKFSHKKQASKVLSQLLFDYFKKLDLNKDFIIIYPNTYFIKSFSRGYNYMYLLALEFSKLTGFKVEKNLIKKIKYTKPQYLAKNRHKNIEGSFKINKKTAQKYKDKNILIIDDITTSGATLEEIINCCLDNNLNSLICLTISKTV